MRTVDEYMKLPYKVEIVSDTEEEGIVIDFPDLPVMKSKYPVIDIVRTGQNIKRIMQSKGLSVKDVQEFLQLATPQSIYHWFDGRNLPTTDNLYALSELFQLTVDAMLVGNRKYKCRCQNKIYQRVLVYYEKINELKAG